MRRFLCVVVTAKEARTAPRSASTSPFGILRATGHIAYTLDRLTSETMTDETTQ